MLSYKSGSLEQLIAYKVSNNPENFLSEVRYLKGSVYVGLRGDDKVMVFKEKGEALEMHCSFKVGNFPRHLNVSEEGFVYVSCQKGDVVQKFLFEADKILMLSETAVPTPTVTVLIE